MNCRRGMAGVQQAAALNCTAFPPAGGIFLGKTNLDQFACGLVGTRTPYGSPGEALEGWRAAGL